ncbi:MAG TPA: hypothetical protein VER11_24400 [Polyangiaceae bacterium]|nr:hypothetical protein [Polyangiaceae bacterium]
MSKVSRPGVTGAALRLLQRALALASLAALGCSQIGPATIANGRFDYNEAIVRSFDSQMLLNLVRLRYQDSILFLDLTSVVASYSREARVGASTDVDVANSSNPTAVGLGATGGMTWSESPTISYAPLQGEDFAKRLLAPIQPSSILLLSRSGWGLERLLICTVQQLNELPNATAIGGVAPRHVNHYLEFGRVAVLLRQLQEDGFIQINTLADQPDQVAITAGPIPMDDLARKRAAEILLLLNISRSTAPVGEQPSKLPGAVNVPAASGGAQPPAEATGPVNAPVPLESGGFPRNPARVMLTGRSVLGVMTFLAQQVEVPSEHLRQGLAHQALGRDGKAFDWNQISHGMFRVHSSIERPQHAFLEVHYRGHWFFIDDTDLESKSTYTLLAQLFSLQSASGSMQTPLLTIPAR